MGSSVTFFYKKVERGFCALIYSSTIFKSERQQYLIHQ